MTVDQWILEYLRSKPEVIQAVGDKVFLYQVPAGTEIPYLHIQLISGVREPKTQSLRYAGAARFQIDLYCSDRYQGRTDMEAVMRCLKVSNVLTNGLRIEQTKKSGPRMLSAEEGYRFSCDVAITWVEEE